MTNNFFQASYSIFFFFYLQNELLSLEYLKSMMTSDCFSRLSQNSSRDRVLSVNSGNQFATDLLTVNDQIKNLCLYLSLGNINEAVIDLTNIQRLKDLRRLWLTYPSKSPVSTDMFLSTLSYTKNLTIPFLPIHELYIEIPLHNIPAMQVLLSHAVYLDILKVCTAHIHKTSVPSLFGSLVDSSLQALVFHDLRCIMEMCESFTDQALASLNSSRLQYLDLSKNEISEIPSGYIIDMERLKYLDVSQNIFTSTFALRLLIEVAVHDKLEVFKMGNLHLAKSNSWTRQRRGVGESLKYCLKKFHIKSMFSPKLAYNSTFCKISQCIQQDGGYSSSLQLHCKAVPTYKELLSLIDLDCTPPVRIPILKSMKELDLSGMVGKNGIRGDDRGNYNKERVICFQNISLERVTFSWNKDFSRRLMLEGYFSNVGFAGITVKVFDVRHNDMTLVLSNATKIFSSMKMKTLHLSGNTIIFANNFDFCEKNMNIEEINLSATDLTNLPRNIFYSCKNANALDLSDNSLTSIDLSFHHNNQLKLLNLSFNQIHTLGNRLTRSLISLSNSMPLKLDLSGNIFHCDCTADGLVTVKFIKNRHPGITFTGQEQLLCFVDGKASLQNIDSMNLKHMLKSCSNNHSEEIGAGIAVNLGLLVIVLCIVFVYKYRYRIKTWYFHQIHLKNKTNKGSTHHISNSLLDDDYAMDDIEDEHLEEVAEKYDAFVSYCAEDRFWVHNVLVKELEDKYGFKLCIHYRDFLAGRPIADEIVKNIKLSRVTIVVLSENALRSSWMRYELDVAHTNSLHYKKKMLVLKLGTLSRNLEWHGSTGSGQSSLC